MSKKSLFPVSNSFQSDHLPPVKKLLGIRNRRSGSFGIGGNFVHQATPTIQLNSLKKVKKQEDVGKENCPTKDVSANKLELNDKKSDDNTLKNETSIKDEAVTNIELITPMAKGK